MHTQSACSAIPKLRATSHTRLRARDHYTSSTLIGGKGGAGPSSLHTMLEGSYMASYVSRFMVTWIIVKNHHLEVGLTQNWEAMAL